jgi:hypothetical protein
MIFETEFFIHIIPVPVWLGDLETGEKINNTLNNFKRMLKAGSIGWPGSLLLKRRAQSYAALPRVRNMINLVLEEFTAILLALNQIAIFCSSPYVFPQHTFRLHWEVGNKILICHVYCFQ